MIKKFIENIKWRIDYPDSFLFVVSYIIVLGGALFGVFALAIFIGTWVPFALIFVSALVRVIYTGVTGK